MPSRLLVLTARSSTCGNIVGIAICHSKQKFEAAACQTHFTGQRLHQIMLGKLAQFSCLPVQAVIEPQNGQADKGRKCQCRNGQNRQDEPCAEGGILEHG
jgi:hypothetical protein